MNRKRSLTYIIDSHRSWPEMRRLVYEENEWAKKERVEKVGQKRRKKGKNIFKIREKIEEYISKPAVQNSLFRAWNKEEREDILQRLYQTECERSGREKGRRDRACPEDSTVLPTRQMSSEAEAVCLCSNKFSLYWL